MSKKKNIPSLLSVTITIQVPFYDVDSLGVVWHGNYAKYFELARCELLDKLGYNYNEMIESGFYWPIIELTTRFIQSIIFRQVILVEAHLMEVEHRLKINYVILDAQSGKRLCKGTSVQVAVDIENRKMQLISPQVLLEKIEVKS